MLEHLTTFFLPLGSVIDQSFLSSLSITTCVGTLEDFLFSEFRSVEYVYIKVHGLNIARIQSIINRYYLWRSKFWVSCAWNLGTFFFFQFGSGCWQFSVLNRLNQPLTHVGFVGPHCYRKTLSVFRSDNIKCIAWYTQSLENIPKSDTSGGDMNADFLVEFQLFQVNSFKQ